MNQIHPSDESMREAMRYAASPEGEQLKTLLRKPNAQGLRAAMEQAAGGDLAGAKATIEAFLATEDGKALLSELRKNP